MSAPLSNTRALPQLRTSTGQLAAGPYLDRPNAPSALTIEVDSNGSPVSVEPALWFICFVPGLTKQWWHPFANVRHKHVFAIRQVDEATWLLVEPWWTRLMVNVVTLDEAVRFLRWGAVGDILAVREAIPGRGSQARGWSNCAVLMSFLLGRPFRTWTPHGLYRRLMAEPESKPVDVPQFLAEHLRGVADRIAGETLATRPGEASFALEDQLFALGTRVMAATMSASSVGLYKVAISEGSRFAGAADAYWTFGPRQAMKKVGELLEAAKVTGCIGQCDCFLRSRQFVAMLRGDWQMEIALKSRQPPDAIEVHMHVKSVVDVFLRGLCRPDNVGRSAVPDHATH